jgi:hypothetical protein
MNGYFLWFYEEEKIGQTGLDFRREKKDTEIKRWESKEIEMNMYADCLQVLSIRFGLDCLWFYHEASFIQVVLKYLFRSK